MIFDGFSVVLRLTVPCLKRSLQDTIDVQQCVKCLFKRHKMYHNNHFLRILRLV